MSMIFSNVELDDKIKMVVFEGVYEPAEDSYLLIKSIDVSKCKKALDMGCGTGIVALHLARYCNVVAADIDEKAVKNTQYNAKMNGIKINAIKSDLFSSIRGKFDIISFNPPYLPTNDGSRAWDGGEGGIEVLKRFFRDAWKHLNENGRIYFIISSLSDMDSLFREYPQYEFKKLGEEKFFFERIYSYLAHFKGKL